MGYRNSSHSRTAPDRRRSKRRGLIYPRNKYSHQIAFEPPVEADQLPPVAPAAIDVLPPTDDVLPPTFGLAALPPSSTCAPQAVNMLKTTPAANLLSMINYTPFGPQSFVRLRC